MEPSSVPGSWKLANVTPIHKKGSKLDKNNYRPITLTSVIGKTMETLIRNKLMSHFESKKLFIDSQHGFLKGRSCMTQLTEVMDYVTREVDNNNSVDIIYLDLQKSFDTVPHLRLITKLKAYGIEGNLLRWIKDFLHCRKQRVVLNGKLSDWVYVTSGIPQGSVLGPTLFIIYINDPPDSIKSLTRLFADDTKLLFTVNNIDYHNSLQNDFNSLAMERKMAVEIQ